MEIRFVKTQPSQQGAGLLDRKIYGYYSQNVILGSKGLPSGWFLFCCIGIFAFCFQKDEKSFDWFFEDKIPYIEIITKQMHIYGMVRQNMTKIYRIFSEFFGVQLCFFHLYFLRFCYRIDI